MKTKLPKYIRSISGAKKLLKELHKNKEGYHPEDDANDIVISIDGKEEGKLFTKEEADKLNELMQQIYALPEVTDEFDPCGYIIDNLLPKDHAADYKQVYAHGNVYLGSTSFTKTLHISHTTHIGTALEADAFLIKFVEALKPDFPILQKYKLKKVRIN